MDVSIIIVNYNTKQLTSECIDSVFEKTEGLEFEIIVIDNASKDGSRYLFSNDNRIKYVYSEHNLGFGRANNLGASIAQGEYLFLLNSDTYLLNNAVFDMWRQMKFFKIKRAKVACVGGMLYSSDGEIIHSYAKFPSMWRCVLNYCYIPIMKRMHLSKGLAPISNYDYKYHKDDSFFDVDTITGADLMIDSVIAKKLGLFDPSFFMYFEETEMQRRYMKAGYRRVIISSPQIVHLEGKSNKVYSPERTSMIIRSMFLYFKKTNTSVKYLLFNIIFKINYIFTHIISFPATNGTIKEKVIHLRDVAII